MKSAAFILSLFFIFTNLNAQIPNAGFENWVDTITPAEWSTNNIPNFWTPVTRSSNSYSGNYAARLEIKDYNGNPIFPIISSQFHVTQNYPTISGFYQFQPESESTVLTILAYYLKGNMLVGSQSFQAETNTSNYTPFTLEVATGNLGDPDSVFIQVQMTSDGDGFGSFALIDELTFGNATSVEIKDLNPSEYYIKQNYPNPFNPSTTIEFSIAEKSFITLKIFDALGREVETLISDELERGLHSVKWNAVNYSGGVYFYQLNKDGFLLTKKMMLIK